MNYLWTQSLFFAIIQKPMKKVPLAFCRGNQFHANSRCAYKVTSEGIYWLPASVTVIFDGNQRTIHKCFKLILVFYKI